MNTPTQTPAVATLTPTPYEIAKASGMPATRFSPDGFAIIEEFSNGQRFLHDPCIGYPVQLEPARAALQSAKE